MRISDWSSDVCSSDLIALDQLAHEEADAELNHEVDGERNGDTQYVARQCHDLIALEAEHGDDGEQQCDERYRTYSGQETRSEEHTSELQSLMRISYAVFCLKKKIKNTPSQLRSHQ